MDNFLTNTYLLGRELNGPSFCSTPLRFWLIWLHPVHLYVRTTTQWKSWFRTVIFYSINGKFDLAS